MKDKDKSRTEEPPRWKPSELVSLTMQFNGRIDALWQRIIYSHAAMVGVMVFFGTAERLYALPRILVVLFYTMNAIVTFFALRDVYNGLRAAVEDLRALAKDDGHLFRWIVAQDYSGHTARRAVMLVVLWAIITYLLLTPVFF